MNLLARRSQARLARQGADLLNRKKDALLREFFALVGDVYELRTRLTEALRREMTEAVVAEAVHGSHALAAAAAAAQADLHVTLTPRSLWGVRIVDLQHDYQPRGLLAGPASPRSTALAVDEVAAGFERIVRDMLDLAPRTASAADRRRYPPHQPPNQCPGAASHSASGSPGPPDHPNPGGTGSRRRHPLETAEAEEGTQTRVRARRKHQTVLPCVKKTSWREWMPPAVSFPATGDAPYPPAGFAAAGDG